jgi:hypothetical protein
LEGSSGISERVMDKIRANVCSSNELKKNITIRRSLVKKMIHLLIISDFINSSKNPNFAYAIEADSPQNHRILIE